MGHPRAHRRPQPHRHRSRRDRGNSLAMLTNLTRTLPSDAGSAVNALAEPWNASSPAARPLGSIGVVSGGDFQFEFLRRPYQCGGLRLLWPIVEPWTTLTP